MWKLVRYAAYYPLIWAIFVFGSGLLHSLLVGGVLALTVPLSIEFVVRRHEKRHS